MAPTLTPGARDADAHGVRPPAVVVAPLGEVAVVAVLELHVVGGRRQRVRPQVVDAVPHGERPGVGEREAVAYRPGVVPPREVAVGVDLARTGDGELAGTVAGLERPLRP